MTTAKTKIISGAFVDRSNKYQAKDHRKVTALFSKLDSSIEAEASMALHTISEKMAISDIIGIIKFSCTKIGFSGNDRNKWLYKYAGQNINHMLEGMTFKINEAGETWSSVIEKIPVEGILASQPET